MARLKQAALDTRSLAGALNTIHHILKAAGNRPYQRGLERLTTKLVPGQPGFRILPRKTLRVKAGLARTIQNPPISGDGIHAVINSGIPASERLKFVQEARQRLHHSGVRLYWRRPDKLKTGGISPAKRPTNDSGLTRGTLFGGSDTIRTTHHHPEVLMHEMAHLKQGRDNVLRNPEVVQRYLNEAYRYNPDGTYAGSKQRTVHRVLHNLYNDPGTPAQIISEIDANAHQYVGMANRYGRQYADTHHNPAGLFSYLAASGGGQHLHQEFIERLVRKHGLDYERDVVPKIFRERNQRYRLRHKAAQRPAVQASVPATPAGHQRDHRKVLPLIGGGALAVAGIGAGIHAWRKRRRKRTTAHKVAATASFGLAKLAATFRVPGAASKHRLGVQQAFKLNAADPRSRRAAHNHLLDVYWRRGARPGTPPGPLPYEAGLVLGGPRTRATVLHRPGAKAVERAATSPRLAQAVRAAKKPALALGAGLLAGLGGAYAWHRHKQR